MSAHGRAVRLVDVLARVYAAATVTAAATVFAVAPAVPAAAPTHKTTVQGAALQKIPGPAFAGWLQVGAGGILGLCALRPRR